jgi:hypothetical protein
MNTDNNNNVKHDFSFWADTENVKSFLEANLLLANLRNAGVEIDDETLEEMAYEITYPQNYNQEFIQEKLGRYLTPTELEVVDVIMNKLLAYDNLMPLKLSENNTAAKHYSRDGVEYIKQIDELKQNTLLMLCHTFNLAQQIRFKK